MTAPFWAGLRVNGSSPKAITHWSLARAGAARVRTRPRTRRTLFMARSPSGARERDALPRAAGARPSLVREDRLLHGRERGGTQDRVGHLLHDGTVLLTVREHADALGILGEGVELGHALVQTLPGQEVDELVVVAAKDVQPVPDLAEAVLLEGLAGESAEAVGDVDDLARH